MPVADVDGGAATVLAPAKLTVSLRVTGVRPDGYHTLDAEMVTVDLCDELTIQPTGGGAPPTGRVGGPTVDGGAAIDVPAVGGLTVIDEVVGGQGVDGVGPGPSNLVCRALAAVGRRATVRLVKRVPPRAGLGGGSADAAAVLRWAGVTDPAVAVALGADVPFCVVGGRARVGGVGEEVEPLPFEDRAYVLMVPPLGVETAACYRAWDALRADGGGAPSDAGRPGGNDLEAPALAVVPELARWRDALADLTGRPPRLAGSGSTWFVEGTPEELGLAGRTSISLGRRRAPLVAVRTVPAEMRATTGTTVGEGRPG